MTPCSPPLLSSFLTLYSCRLPMCSQGHTGYFFITGNSPPRPLFPHHISSSFHCLCSFHLSVEPNPVIHSLIQWVLSAWLFICLHFAALSAEVLSICPNRQNTGSVYFKPFFTQGKLAEQLSSFLPLHITFSYSHPRQPHLSQWAGALGV